MGDDSSTGDRLRGFRRRRGWTQEHLAEVARTTHASRLVHLWMELLRAAQRDVGLLAFARLFLTEEHPEWLDTLAAKAQDGVRVRPLLGDPAGVDTPLYNSIYRFDDDLVVNMHAYGVLAAHTPVMHLRRIDGRYFNTYVESYERVWASARPASAPVEV